MVSVMWSGLVALLAVELVVVGILVLPLPRRFRRYIAFKVQRFKVGPRLRMFSQWILLALVAALAESINTFVRLEGREQQPADSGGTAAGAAGGEVGFIEGSMDKQVKFRAERNIYLAGFALTLLAVIKRILELMELSRNLEEDGESEKKRSNEIAGAGDREESSHGSVGASSMKTFGSKWSALTSKAS